MQIDSLSYLLLFLPLTAAGYFVLPARMRSGWLLLVSLLYYSLLQPWYLPLMLGDLWLCFKLAPLVGAGGRSAKHALYGAVVANLLLLVAASALNQIYQTELPFGLFLYTLTALGYLLDVQSGEAAPEDSFVHFAAACCFYPKLYAGPLVPYQSLAQDLRRADVNLPQVGRGFARFVRGLAKKVIIAGLVTALLTQIKAFSAEEQTVLSVWTLVVCASFSAYFTFSGYCDMAQGLGQVFGLQLPRNFRYPFEAKTVGDFFNRFNTTVSEYIRKHVYTRLGSESGGALSTSLNILLITMLMGLWYGLRLNLLVWGAVLGVFVMMETLLFPKIFKDVPQFYSRIYTFAITFISFAIFTGDSLTQSMGYLAAMFGVGGVTVYNQSILYLLDSNYLVLLAAVFASTSLTSRIAGDFKARVPRLGGVLGALTHAGILALTVGFLLGGAR